MSDTTVPPENSEDKIESPNEEGEGYGPPEDIGVKTSQVVSTGPILPGIGDNIMSGWSLVGVMLRILVAQQLA